ncbi:ArsR/SmtB family transcription factor [Gracilimonas tropica]|uniref:ArsR/SmtB family transcription factor n=1 Tax=Gracilimonas tropica TaxID=454600 RepID=UPI00036D51E5|nr:metalloregulator ArsR/SmtB family transcription factor [Gracilimonas tropica]
MLDSTLYALSDATRRSILGRLAQKEYSVNEIAEPYDMSLAAVSKHLKVLEKADLITKRKEGRSYKCCMNYTPLKEVESLIKEYKQFWESRFDELEHFLSDNEPDS